MSNTNNRIRTSSDNRVSEENIQKVIDFFVKRVKATGSNRIEAIVTEIADGSGVALATAHKALKQLASERVLTIVKPSSRRYPITYIFNGSVEEVEQARKEMSQIEYLQNLVIDLTAKIQRLEKENQDLAGQFNAMQNRQPSDC